MGILHTAHLRPRANVARHPLAGLDRLRAEGLLNAEQATSDIMGKAVKVEVRFPGGKAETFQGKIVFVSPEIHPVNGKVRVWAEVENRNGLLRPGLSVAMAINSPNLETGPAPSVSQP